MACAMLLCFRSQPSLHRHDAPWTPRLLRNLFASAGKPSGSNLDERLADDSVCLKTCLASFGDPGKQTTPTSRVPATLPPAPPEEGGRVSLTLVSGPSSVVRWK